MMNAMNVTEIASALIDAGLEVPPEVDEAIELEAAIGRFREWAGAGAEIRELREAIGRREVSPDELPRRLREIAIEQVIAGQRNAVAGDMASPIRGLAYDAVRARGDELLEELRPRFERAAEAIAGSLDPVERKGLMRGPAYRSVATAERDAALEVLAEIARVRRVLAICGYGPGESAAWFVAKPEDRDALVLANRCYHDGSFVELAEYGYTLRLNTAERVDEVNTLLVRKPPVDLLAGIGR